MKPIIEKPLKTKLRQRVCLGLSKEWLRRETMRATNIDDYIPIELYHEAADFVKRIDEDVEIYGN